MNQLSLLDLFDLITLFKHLYLNFMTNPQWIFERLKCCVNNNQTQPRFHFYKLLYWTVTIIFPCEYRQGKEKLGKCVNKKFRLHFQNSFWLAAVNIRIFLYFQPAKFSSTVRMWDGKKIKMQGSKKSKLPKEINSKCMLWKSSQSRNL